jgi:hypothetical protein
VSGHPDPFPLDLDRSAVLLGAYCAVERSLFELTGALAAQAGTDPAARVALDAWSAEHAWHAELFADRLPVLADLDTATLVELPAPAAEMLGYLSAAPPLERLAGLLRVVLPRLVTTYRRHLEVASAASEGPTRRALRLALRDEVEALVAGEALLEALLDDPERVARVGQAAVAAESALARGKVGPGLIAWPVRRA